MTYRVGTIPYFDRETKTETTKPFRQNDGSLVIMHGAEGDDDVRPALIVPRIAPVKRAEAYSAPDPEQEAFAQRIVDLLNANPVT